MIHSYELIAQAGIGLLIIILLIALLKMPPFVGILIGSLITGFMMGIPIEKVLSSFEKGAGEIMGATGLIIAAGAMLGGVLAKSGAAECIASVLLKNTPLHYLSWTVALCAMIIGLPLFFEVGLVMMLPMIIALSKNSGLPFVKVALPALAGMTTLHALVPPHPGPLIAIHELQANLGLTMMIGILIALPTVIIAGPLYSHWLAPREPDIGKNISFESFSKSSSFPPFGLSVSVILLPIVLMMLHSYASMVLKIDSKILSVITFVGQPLVALIIAVVFAVIVLKKNSQWSLKEAGEVLTKSLPPIAVLLLTIGAGGGLKQVLLQAHISQAVSEVGTSLHIPLLILAYIIAIAIRQATGSATVSTTTTSGIVASIASSMSDFQTTLLVLVIGSGSVFFCHINDAGFWMVKSFFNIGLKQTLWMWSVLQTLVSVCGFMLCVLLWYFVA